MLVMTKIFQQQKVRFVHQNANLHLYFFSGFLIALWFPPSSTCRHEYTAIYEYYNNDCGLTEIPTDIPSGAYQVWLDGNQIANIEARALSHLAHCTFLVLDRNKLTNIRVDMWDG